MPQHVESSPPGKADQMPALAAEFVQACRQQAVNLDFLPRTLPLVDQLLNRARASLQHASAGRDPQAAAAAATHAVSIAAYVGEVIRKDTGGRWYDFDDRAMLDVGEYQADPLPVVSALLESGQARDGDVPIASLKAYCEMIGRMQRVWLDGTVIGTYESMAAARRSMTPDAKLAGAIVAHSQAAVRTAKLEFDASLDFSSESLEQVERIMTSLHQRTDATGDDRLTTEQIEDLAVRWGIYVGEVIRRCYGGQWANTGSDPDLLLAGKQAAPIEKIRRRIRSGPLENVKNYFASIMKVLSSQQQP